MSDDTNGGNNGAPERLEYAPGKGYRVRLRYGKGLRGRFWIKLDDEALAEKRAVRLRELADALGRSGHSARAPIILEEAAACVSDKDFADAVEMAEKLCGGKINVPKLVAARTTVQELGEDWTEGRLHKRYPDQIKAKRTVADDEGRLKNYVYPVIGSKLVTAVTLDDAEEIMRRLPDDLAPLTRRGIAALVARVMKLAVYPLRLIAASPIPAGFVPGKGKRKALACLYPDEVRRLLACRDVPFCFRLLYGFLVSEGMRAGEAMAVTWGDLDLTRGAVRLDKNKTDDPRAWALLPGTTAALKAYRATLSPEPKPEALVFLDPLGRQHSKFGAAELLRSHLRAIGLYEERPELFETTDERRQIRVHDLRGVFVTVALANDRSESWIADRTGHTSSIMINRYKRAARTFAELGLGDLAPLVDALPDLSKPVASGPPARDDFKSGWAQGGPAMRNPARKRASPTGFEGETSKPGERDGADLPGNLTEGKHENAHEATPRPALPFSMGQSEPDPGPPSDPVEAALARAITLASEAGEWTVVAELGRELSARRLARSAPEVATLEAERAKRTGKGG